MMIKKALTLAGAAFVLALVQGGAQAADAEAGGETFKRKCGACHTLDQARVGPPLGGVVGRQAGTADFSRYVGLKDVDFTWTPELLDEYLADPTAFVKANSDNKRSGMAFKLPDEEERQNVIAYLQTTKAQ